MLHLPGRVFHGMISIKIRDDFCHEKLWNLRWWIVYIIFYGEIDDDERKFWDDFIKNVWSHFWWSHQGLVSSFKPLKKMHVKSESCEFRINDNLEFSSLTQNFCIQQISFCFYFLITVVPKNMFPKDILLQKPLVLKEHQNWQIDFLPKVFHRWLSWLSWPHDLLGSQTSVLTQWQSAAPWRLPEVPRGFRKVYTADPVS